MYIRVCVSAQAGGVLSRFHNRWPDKRFTLRRAGRTPAAQAGLGVMGKAISSGSNLKQTPEPSGLGIIQSRLLSPCSISGQLGHTFIMFHIGHVVAFEPSSCERACKLSGDSFPFALAWASQRQIQRYQYLALLVTIHSVWMVTLPVSLVMDGKGRLGLEQMGLVTPPHRTPPDLPVGVLVDGSTFG